MLFIHGLWMNAGSWDSWVEEFDDNGYDSINLSRWCPWRWRSRWGHQHVRHHRAGPPRPGAGRRAERHHRAATLELADPATLDKVARVRAKVRAHVWSLICALPAGFPWLAIAGKVLAGWLVIDLDGTLITARSDKEGAAPTFKMATASTRSGPGWPIPPSRWPCCCGRQRRSNTFADHLTVLTAAIRQIPARMRSKLLVRVDGAGASHELITHLLSLASRRRTVLFTCGWRSPSR